MNGLPAQDGAKDAMKILLAVLFGSLMAGTGFAQDGASTLGPRASQPPMPFTTQSPGEPNCVATGPACCPPRVQKICVPEPTKTKTVKTVYDCKCVDYCLPKCPCCPCCGCCTLWPCFHKDCGCQSCPSCTKPRTRTVLVKKFVTTEEQTFKCVVKVVGCPCPEGPCGPGCLPGAEEIRLPASPGR
jgi:hypothetical protein